MITSELREDGIRVITCAHPPVNARPVDGWFQLGEKLDEAGADLETKVVAQRSEGKGFNAGVDIKEMPNTSGFTALIGANKSYRFEQSVTVELDLMGASDELRDTFAGTPKSGHSTGTEMREK